MFPSLHFGNFTHGGYGQIEVQTDGLQCLSACATCADYANAVWVHFCQWALSTAPNKLRATPRPMVFSVRPSMPRVHIGLIIFHRAKSQVGRIYARRVVAIMKHKQAVWYCAPTQCIRKAVRPYFFGADGDRAIAQDVQCSLPNPALAIVCWKHLSPEALLNGNGAVSILISHAVQSPILNGLVRLAQVLNTSVRAACIIPRWEEIRA